MKKFITLGPDWKSETISHCLVDIYCVPNYNHFLMPRWHYISFLYPDGTKGMQPGPRKYGCFLRISSKGNQNKASKTYIF